ncbi:MAG: hypothetical protein ABI596_11970 [Pyrinomonadaceae bacterium]
MSLALLCFSLTSLFFLLAALLEVGAPLLLALLLPDTLLLRPLLLLILTLLCFSLASLLFLLASFLAYSIALFPALLQNALRCSLLVLSLALRRGGLALLFSLLLSLLAFCAPLLLLLVLRLGRLLVILATVFLPLSPTTPPLRLNLDAGADKCDRREGQHGRKALEMIKSHGSS